MRPSDGAAVVPASVDEWLQGLGLGQYAGAFARNAIEIDVLPDLTVDDLKDLGVELVGHRRRLLSAIATLRGERPSAHAAPSGVMEAAKEQGGVEAPAAERRQLTVMFCDLVGSTALAARFDPEDLRKIIGAYHVAVAEQVKRFDGYIARYMGDGVLVYFGYPLAHEDDAERAVRAGLAIVERVDALATAAQLQTRVGIATGLVVVGELIGAGEARERSVVGETPNLAARMQGIAEPNMVVIAESTRRLLGNLFELSDLGEKNVKGVAGPVRAWAALRASSVESRFEALQMANPTALVGREEEVDLLMRRWTRAKAGEGQVVLLSGEAGIGKSRLTAALLERLGDEPHIRLRYFCSPQHTDSAFYPVVGQFERAAGIAHDDGQQARHEKLAALLAETSTSAVDAALFAEMLSLPNDGRYPVLELEPQQRRQRTIRALATQLQTLARSRPVLMIVEDAHWTDPTSLEVFGRAVAELAGQRALAVVTFRPEFEPPWIGLPHVTSLTLNRLAPRDVGAMIDRIIGNALLPAGMRHDIVDRTDGIPLFVEEMTKAVLEAESEGGARQVAAAAPSAAGAVPASLHASLMARLDRLGPAKELAQVGAALGREFSHALLAAVMRRPEAELGSALGRLVRAGLLFRQGEAPHATYLFKHALVQDAAYGTLLREQRQALNARIAETLADEFPEIAASQPELLARHYTQAGQIAKASEFWGKAGLRSLARSALVEAAEQLSRALAQLVDLPPTPTLRRERIKLQVALIAPLIHTKGFAAAETKAAVERAHLLIEQAEALGEPVDDPLLLFSVLYGFWVANLVAFNGDVLCELATQFLALAEKQAGSAPRMVGHRLMGISLLCTGATVQGRTHLDRALALYDPVEHRPLATQFGQDSCVSILCYRSWAQWMLGHCDAALADTEQALKAAREIGQAATLMNTVALTTLTHIFRGNHAAAIAQCDEVVGLANDKGAEMWRAFGMLNRGCVLALGGQAAMANQIIGAVVAAWRSTGASVLVPLYMSFLARARAELGQLDEARHAIEEAMALSKATKEALFEAELNRVAGEIALKGKEPDVVRAEAHFDLALAIARAQQAKSWELRAAASRARLWRDQGRRTEAHALLAPVYGWFTEGFDTADLKEAKALLSELA